MSYLTLNDVSLQFKVFRSSTPTLKKKIVHLLTGREDPDECHSFWALKDISLDFRKGDKIGLVGGNGAGKSTLLRTMCGIYPPTSGVVQGEGKLIPLLELGTGFDVTRTVRENIYLCGATLGNSREQMRLLMDDILGFAEMEEFVDSPVSNLSSGMKSRIAFSIATAVQPEILLLDEVFAAGDARFINKARARMEGLIERCHILVFVSHSEELVRAMCNRAVLLDGGRVKMQGDVDEVFKVYNETVVNR